MTKFQSGDRVVFNQSYSSQANRGDTARVVGYRQRHDRTLVTVTLDKGGDVICFDRRLDRDFATNPAPKAHVFKLGDKGLTRDGREYEVLAVFPTRAKPILVDVAGSVSDRYLDGSTVEARTTHSDLIPTKRVRTFYVNVYEKSVQQHDTAQSARLNAMSTALIVAHPVTIELP